MYSTKSASVAAVAAFWSAFLLAAAPAAGITVSCVGDSITTGAAYEYLDPTRAYPAVLQATLDAQYGSGVFTILNRGLNGEEANEVYDDLLGRGWLDENPDAIFLMIGGNDLTAAFDDVSNFTGIADQTVVEVQQSIDRISAHTNPTGSSPRIIVSSIPPNLLGEFANWGVSYYNSRLQSQLTGYDLFFTDNFYDLYDSDTYQADAALMFPDLMFVHPNADGLAIIAENWRQQMQLLPDPLLLSGDADGSGVVNVGDLGIWAANWGGSGKLWKNGDFTGNGVVDMSDFDILSANYNTSAFAMPAAGVAFAAAPVPEPRAFLALLLAAPLLPRRRGF